MMNLRFIRITDRYLGIFLCYILYFLEKWKKYIFGKEKKREKDKILMMKFWGIGNLVMILPTIRAVRERYPKAKIDIFTLSNNKGVLQHNPWIDNIYFLESKNFFVFVTTYLRNVFRARKERYDMILDFEQFAKTSSVFALLSGARERIGFDTPGQGRGIAYTRRVAYLDYKHMVETFFRIAKGAGVEEADLSPVKLDIKDKEKRKVEFFLKNNSIQNDDIIIGVHIGCGDNMMMQRRWPKERFAQLGDRLIEKYSVKVVFTGTGEEEILVKETLSLMKNKHSAISAADKFNIKELAAFIKRCKFFVSNDTAPVHIASAMGIPVVGFYGPNTPGLYGPRGKNDLVFYKDPYCSPCITNYNAKISKCNDPRCVVSITVEEVFKGIEKKYF